MTSTRKKGMKREREVEKKLQSEGWITQRAMPPTKFSKKNDLFGLWDLLTLIRPNINVFTTHQNRKWIQVKTNSNPSKEWFKRARYFKDKYCDLNDSCEVHIFWKRGKRKKKKGWEIIQI